MVQKTLKLTSILSSLYYCKNLLEDPNTCEDLPKDKYESFRGGGGGDGGLFALLLFMFSLEHVLKTKQYETHYSVNP